MRRADRLFQIVLQLGRGRVLTAGQLADRLEVSVRTVYRDVRDLISTRVPIDGEAGVGYRLRRGYHVPPMMFDETELQALMFGAAVAKSYGDPAMAEAADRILAKVDAVLPEHLRAGLNSTPLVVPDPHQSDAAAAILGIARRAINERMRLFIDYCDIAGERSERIVWPLALEYWGRTWTLGAWCELRQDFRSFRIDRVREGKALASSIPDVAGRRLDDYFAARRCQSEE